MGDEQGGSYHPAGAAGLDAVDVLRIDPTTNGGITGMRRVLDQPAGAGDAVAPHMYPHLHSQVLPALGATEVPIEWGVPGTGVHPMDDCLDQPVVGDGLMDPLPGRRASGRSSTASGSPRSRSSTPTACSTTSTTVEEHP